MIRKSEKGSEAFGNDSIILFSSNIANVTYTCVNGDGYEKRKSNNKNCDAIVVICKYYFYKNEITNISY